MASPFKVIVVGGGPVGLIAAHALTRAGIDFLMLERRPSVVEDVGASVVLQAQGLRAMGQLGLLDAINAAGTSLTSYDRVDHQGRNMGNLQWFEFQKENAGTYPLVVGRHDLTQILYEALPEGSKAKILTNKSVTTVSTSDDNTAVRCADDTSYTGSIVIGADGAHSQIRGQMRKLAIEAGETEVNEEKPFLTTYRCLWLRYPTSIAEGLTEGSTCESHGSGCTSQQFAGEETTVVAIYEKMEAPTKDRVRYTDADKGALVGRWGHMPLDPRGNFTLKQAYEGKTHSALVSLEEGVLDHWSWDGRIVLAGDSAHKYTPSTGAGCNTGVVDIVVLVNKLRKELINVRKASGNPDATLNRSQTAAVFEDYQEARRKTVVAECSRSGNATAMASWQTGAMKLMDQYVLTSHWIQKYFASKGKAHVSRTPVFDFIEGEEAFEGNVPWEFRIPQRSAVVN